MNANEILDMIGDAKNGYIWDAQQIRTGNLLPAKKKLPVKKLWLIAAIIAMMLMLVGCAVVYVLHLQDLQVGEHNYIQQYQDKNGNQIASEEKTSILISLQNVHQEALAEWLAFQESYDQDGSLMAANDNNESGVPEPYYFIYDCYTWDMVDKLEEIADKYNLHLLGTDVNLQYYESQVLFDALKIDGLIHKDAPIDVEYLSSYFYPEGTFDMDFQISSANKPLYDELLVSIRYSLKDYFDPVISSLDGDIQDYEQWNYTCKDGTALLLIMNAESARIYADLPNAFISIHINTAIQDVSITKAQLEEIAEYFDFSIQPQAADLAGVEQLLEKARKDYEADKAAVNQSLYNHGYATYIQQMLEKAGTPSFPEDAKYMTYALHDVNGDGLEELIVCGYGALYDIISTRDGESFHYFDANDLPATPVVYPCENNIIEIYDSMTGSHYYFKAEAEGASFLVGLCTNQNIENPQWGRLSDFPHPDPSQRNLEAITAEEANNIIASYQRIELDWKPITEYPLQ